jgi:hypothetical protein
MFPNHLALGSFTGSIVDRQARMFKGSPEKFLCTPM